MASTTSTTTSKTTTRRTTTRGTTATTTDTCSMLDSLLATAAAHAAAAAAAAERAAAEQAAADRAAACQATDTAFGVIADATANAQHTGGDRGVSSFMGALATFASGGGTAPTGSPAGGDAGWVSRADHDAVVTERDRALTSARNLQSALDAARSAMGDMIPRADHNAAVEAARAVVPDGFIARATYDRDVASARAEVPPGYMPVVDHNTAVAAVWTEIGEVVRDLPEIDLTAKTFGGGAIKVPASDAAALAEGRLTLRQLAGLDPAPAPTS